MVGVYCAFKISLIRVPRAKFSYQSHPSRMSSTARMDSIVFLYMGKHAEVTMFKVEWIFRFVLISVVHFDRNGIAITV